MLAQINVININRVKELAASIAQQSRRHNFSYDFLYHYASGHWFSIPFLFLAQVLSAFLLQKHSHCKKSQVQGLLQNFQDCINKTQNAITTNFSMFVPLKALPIGP